jgi:hypothetical protein
VTGKRVEHDGKRNAGNTDEDQERSPIGVEQIVDEHTVHERDTDGDGIGDSHAGEIQAAMKRMFARL